TRAGTGAAGRSDGPRRPTASYGGPAMTVPPVPSARPDDPRDGSVVRPDADRSGYVGHDELTASFDAFYKESRDRLVVQTLALTGDLAVARSAVREAFVVTWHHWRKHVR